MELFNLHSQITPSNAGKPQCPSVDPVQVLMMWPPPDGINLPRWVCEDPYRRAVGDCRGQARPLGNYELSAASCYIRPRGPAHGMGDIQMGAVDVFAASVERYRQC
jgi:hypothetical protein